MTNDEFEALTPEGQKAVLARLAISVFGAPRAMDFARKAAPLVRNLSGHGRATEHMPGGTPEDPATNFWEGAWQIYRAE